MTKILFSASFLHVEIHAILCGLKLTLDFDFHSIIVEYDSFLVKSKINVGDVILRGGEL